MTGMTETPHARLFDRVTSASDVLQLRQELEVLQKALYQVKTDAWENALSSQVRTWVAAEISASVTNDTQSKEQVLQDLLKQLEAIKTLRLTIAFEPSDIMLTKVREWVKAELGSMVVLEIEYQPSLIGGAIITWNGKYFNASVRQALDAVFDKAYQSHFISLHVLT